MAGDVRILYWLHTFLPQLGGIQTFSARLIPELVQKGHQVEIVGAHGSRPAPDKSRFADSVTVHRLDMVAPLYKKDLSGMLAARRRIAAIVDDFQPDLIHLHPSGPELIYYLQIMRQRRLPTVVTIHNNYAHSKVSFEAAAGLGQTLRQADWVTAVSNDALNWLREALPELDSKSSVIHNGLPPHEGPIAPLPWAPPILLFVGRLSAQKRVDVMLHALAQVLADHPLARLRIVGDGEERAALSALAAELDIAGSVDFVGRVAPEEIVDHLAAATLFVISSDYEGLPIAVLEAAQMARPIVSTAVGGVPEVVTDGESGRLVPPRQPLQLAAAIGDLLSDPVRAAAMGDAGRRRVARDFVIGVAANAYEALYERVAPSPQGVIP